MPPPLQYQSTVLSEQGERHGKGTNRETILDDITRTWLGVPTAEVAIHIEYICRKCSSGSGKSDNNFLDVKLKGDNNQGNTIYNCQLQFFIIHYDLLPVSRLLTGHHDWI